jgi:hypothetical protein
MYRRVLLSLSLAALFGIPAIGTFTAPAEANHSWGSYHWARTANPFPLKLGDNVSSAWDSILATTSGDWNTPTGGAKKVLNTTIVSGRTDPRKCRATSGQVEVCNAAYGKNGWLGIATIWISGSHITQGTVKLNDSYFNSSPYNTTAWRNLVSCQEVGHTFGLDHQDENFNNTNLNTCMDYTNDPGTNQHPNQHDYDQLATIYTHLDNFNSYSTSTAQAPSPRGNQSRDDEPGDSPSDWGRAVASDASGRANVYELDLGGGQKKITHVFWVQKDHGDGNDNRP